MNHFPHNYSGLPNQYLPNNGVHASARIGRLSLILCGIGYLCIFAAAGYGQQNGYQGDVTDVRVIRRVEQHPYAWKVWQPFIIQGHKKKELLVAFGVQVNGKNDMGDILASLSRDDGDTWEEPVPVFDHRQRQGAIQFAYANPVLYRAPGQNVIWCFAMRCPMVYRNSEESHLVGAFTADGGRSWTPVEMAMQYTGPLILNAGIVETEIKGQKRFLLPAHRNTLQKDPFGSRDHFILSSTSLLEWKLEAFIPQPVDHKVFLHEGNIAPGDAPGELKIVMRTAQYDEDSLTTDPPRAYSSVSRDGGHTWSPAVPEPELHNAKSKGFFGRAADGTHIYVYNDGPAQRDIAPGFPHGGRTSLRYKIKPARRSVEPGEDLLPRRHQEFLPHAYRGRARATSGRYGTAAPRTHHGHIFNSESFRSSHETSLASHHYGIA